MGEGRNIEWEPRASRYTSGNSRRKDTGARHDRASPANQSTHSKGESSGPVALLLYYSTAWQRRIALLSSCSSGECHMGGLVDSDPMEGLSYTYSMCYIWVSGKQAGIASHGSRSVCICAERVGYNDLGGWR